MCSVHSDVEIYLPCMYASLAHHSILTSSFVSSHLSLVKNTFSSSRSSYTRANTLPRDNHRTSVWSNKTLCSALISSHRDANMRLFSDLAFTKFIIRTTSSSTGARSAGKGLATSASRCKNKCVTITSGCLSFTRLKNPFVLPTMAAAPSVQTLTVFPRKSSLLKIF